MNLVSAIAPTAGPATDDAQQRALTPIATQGLAGRIEVTHEHAYAAAV